MAENCTIYANQIDLASMARAVKDVFKMDTLFSTAAPTMVAGQEGSIQFSIMQFGSAGDSFSRLRLSTYMFLDRIVFQSGSIKDRTLLHIESTEAIIGVVVSPSFDADDRYHAIVFRIAALLNGLILTEAELLDLDGNTIVRFA